MRPPRSVTLRFDGSMRRSPISTSASPSGSSFVRAMPALRSAAFTRLRNSCIENGFVM